jgi:outer membrane protein OmpA-like peptidoglycan-associated protein
MMRAIPFRFVPAFTLSLASFAASAGCATQLPPSELVDARAAYARAHAGGAAQSEPEELAEAKRFLDAAERWQVDDPGSEEARNLAYVAQRKALTAEADAASSIAEVDQARELQALAVLRRLQLADAHNRLEKADDEASAAGRSPSSRRAKEAIDRLSPFAGVSQRKGDLVLTLADSVLFDGDTAKLMATARERLDRVAQALQELSGRSISVKGYMDASGDDAHDAELRAVGLGTADPVASDASVEGRQQNRRVEIVVEGMGQDAGTR